MSAAHPSLDSKMTPHGLRKIETTRVEIPMSHATIRLPDQQIELLLLGLQRQLIQRLCLLKFCKMR